MDSLITVGESKKYPLRTGCNFCLRIVLQDDISHCTSCDRQICPLCLVWSVEPMGTDPHTDPYLCNFCTKK